MEEDLFNLVARSKYERIPNYRELSPQQEQELLRRHLNRVTDTCIPEEEAMRRIERAVLDEWKAASENNDRKFPHEFLYKILRECRLKQFYEIDPADSWMVGAAHKNLPLFVPGWEDSTLGNIYAARCITGAISNVQAVRSGIEYMIELAAWYRRVSKDSSIGFFQIGGGIAGDFPICVVPMLNQDVVSTPVPEWGYFCQISDSTTSFGSYSGAVPNEKITWGKLNVDTPRFVIESDATIVAPLLFAKVLGW
jgi:deoxyhypusine synthase